MGELEPLSFRSGVADISNFSNFAVPQRAFTPAEQAVYDQAGVGWARFSQAQKLSLYIQLVEGQLAVLVNEIFLTAAENIKARAADIDDPEIQLLAQKLRQATLTELVNHQIGHWRTTSTKLAELQSLPSPAPPAPPAPPSGFWQRVLWVLQG